MHSSIYFVVPSRFLRRLSLWPRGPHVPRPPRLWSYVKVIFIFLFISCAHQKNTIPIEDNIAFPGKLLTISDSEFLLLKTNASNKYDEGSIQRYEIDKDLKTVLKNTLIIDTHASDIALTSNKSLLALSFDGSKTDTKIY